MIRTDTGLIPDRAGAAPRRVPSVAAAAAATAAAAAATTLIGAGCGAKTRIDAPFGDSGDGGVGLAESDPVVRRRGIDDVGSVFGKFHVTVHHFLPPLARRAAAFDGRSPFGEPLLDFADPRKDSGAVVVR